ncbi:MAG: hypothetical protein Q7S81_00315, partial [bacterium]|nr:hypothetical protein [bacterium]
MNNINYRSFLVWGAIFLFIEIILLFFYFNFSHQKIDGLDQFAQIFTTKASEQNNFPVLKQNQAGLALSAEAYISIFAADDGSSFAPPSPKA